MLRNEVHFIEMCTLSQSAFAADCESVARRLDGRSSLGMIRIDERRSCIVKRRELCIRREAKQFQVLS